MTLWKEWLAPTGLVDSLPVALGEQTWSPTQADEKAAWSLYSEICSRITTQPLHYRSGDEATALKSVYELFGKTRALCQLHGAECATFTELSWFVLNEKVRPFTARWHRRQENSELRSDDTSHEFRHQLRELQVCLRGFEAALLGIATKRSAAPVPVHPKSEPLQDHFWHEPQALTGVAASDDVATQILQAERATIAQRRRSAGSTNAFTVGLALSGGGIRSATFCLGVVQALAQRGVMRDVDYVSTVSGGGYLGASLSAFVNKDTDAKTLLAADGPYLRHLRQRARRHLLGKEPGKQFTAVIMTWASALALSAAIVWLLTIAGALLVALASIPGPSARAWIGGLLLLAFGAGAVAPRRPGAPSWLQRIGAVGLCGLLAGAAFLLLQRVDRATGGGCHALVWMIGTSLALTTLALALRPRWPGVTRALLATILAALVPLALLFAAFALHGALTHGTTWQHATIVVGALVLALVVLAGCDINLTSFHPLYRARLADTFLTTAQGPHIPRLDALHPHDSPAPYHLINAAVNLPASAVDGLRDRRADFFVFSHHFCGSPTTGYYPTSDLTKLDPNLDLATAVAASAAAASAHMGRLSRARHARILALLNVRLGYWLPNPKSPRQPARPGLPMLWRELTSQMHEKLDFWNVSDGGHIENLGIYELLRRQCHFIIAIDAEADPSIARAGLMHCLNCAKIDLGIDVHMDAVDFATSNSGWTRSHFQLGVIDYAAQAKSGAGSAQTARPRGYLLYIKASMTGDEHPLLVQYRARHPSFPHQTTADQFFDEEQFEVYRALGEHIGRQLLREEIVGHQGDVSATELLAALRHHLLADDQVDRQPSEQAVAPPS